MLEGDLAHDTEKENVVVRADRGGFEHGGQLELRRRHFVVAGLGRNAQAPQLAIEVLHEGQDALADRAEVLVFQLLPLGRGRTEQGSAGQHQVGTKLGQTAIDKEVLLLGADGGEDPLGRGVAEPLENAHGLLGNGFLRTQQWDLLIKGLAGVRNEGRGDGQGHPVGLDL